MADEALEKRRIELAEAFEAAFKALALHMGTDTFDGHVDGHPYVTGDWAQDRDRLMAMEALKMNIGPGESFQENAPWIASFHTHDQVYVFAGDTLREAVDKAMIGAAARAEATRPS